MSSRLIVDRGNRLQEFRETERLKQHPAIRLIAKIISYVFHPVFVPVYIVLFLLYVHPAVFAGFTGWEKKLVLIQAFLMYGFFPIVSVLLLKALKFINSIYLITQRDRIIPYIVCNIWYFWIWIVWRGLPDPAYPREAIIFAMTIFLASSIGLMANIYMKISMHAIAIGVMLSFMMELALTQAVSFGIYISAAIFIAGLVCTARFMVSDHSQKEIYGGLLAGFVALLIGNIFI
jgi:hypothetical protein